MKFKYEIHAEVFPLKHDGDMDKANKILIYRTYGNIVSTYISYFYILNIYFLHMIFLLQSISLIVNITY